MFITVRQLYREYAAQEIEAVVELENPSPKP